MDERPHHESPLPTAQDGHGLAQPHDRPTPWPGAAPAPAGAPIAGSLPYHAPLQHGGQPPTHAFQPWQSQGGMPAAYPQAPSHHGGHPFHEGAGQPTPQYSYAPGFVLPGAAAGQAPPMSAHGATIGSPPAGPALAGHVAFGHGDGAPAGTAWHSGSAALVPQELPQAWAYQTPHGLQLVQPGAAAYAAQPASAGEARRRIRWETIVPAMAVTCLIAALGVFIADFPRMTGRDQPSADAAAARTVETADDASSAPMATSTADAGDTAGVVEQARGFFEQGRFDDAANLLHPLLDVESPDPAAVTLHDQVDAAAARNRALLGRLSRERSAGRWSAVVGTIGELEGLRPLSKDLVQLRGTARRALRVQAIVTKAKGLMARGRNAEALAIVERGLEPGRNRTLEKLREQLSARMAAPAARPSSMPGSRPAPPRPGGAAARPSRPAQPPANVPRGAIPARPDLPNPTGGGSSVAPAVAAGGGGGADCHEHDGVRECH